MDATMKNKKENSQILSLLENQLSNYPFLNKTRLNLSTQNISDSRNANIKKILQQPNSILLITHQILITN
jgi:hypothetical protein